MIRLARGFTAARQIAMLQGVLFESHLPGSALPFGKRRLLFAQVSGVVFGGAFAISLAV